MKVQGVCEVHGEGGDGEVQGAWCQVPGARCQVRVVR